MTTPWALTIDCEDARVVMAFWREALGYVDAPPPEGFDTWETWLRHFDVPEEEWGDGGALIDPEGRLPQVGFLRVPEGKVVKNRIHLDLKVSGGRHLDPAVRRERILARVEQLVAAGATIVREDTHKGALDHVLLVDPEGNEFCVV